MPVPLGPGGKVVLHVVPLPSFADNRLMDVVAAVAAGTHIPLPLGGMIGANRTSVKSRRPIKRYRPLSYGCGRATRNFFRSGAIEGVGELSRRDEDSHPYFVAPSSRRKSCLRSGNI